MTSPRVAVVWLLLLLAELSSCAPAVLDVALCRSNASTVEAALVQSCGGHSTCKDFNSMRVSVGGDCLSGATSADVASFLGSSTAIAFSFAPPQLAGYSCATTAVIPVPDSVDFDKAASQCRLTWGNMTVEQRERRVFVESAVVFSRVDVCNVCNFDGAGFSQLMCTGVWDELQSISYTWRRGCDANCVVCANESTSSTRPPSDCAVDKVAGGVVALLVPLAPVVSCAVLVQRVFDDASLASPRGGAAAVGVTAFAQDTCVPLKIDTGRQVVSVVASIRASGDSPAAAARGDKPLLSTAVVVALGVAACLVAGLVLFLLAFRIRSHIEPDELLHAHAVADRSEELRAFARQHDDRSSVADDEDVSSRDNDEPVDRTTAQFDD